MSLLDNIIDLFKKGDKKPLEQSIKDGFTPLLAEVEEISQKINEDYSVPKHKKLIVAKIHTTIETAQNDVLRLIKDL